MPVPVPVPVTGPDSAPDSCPAPPPVRPPYSAIPVRFPCPALPGDGNGRRCRPGVRRGTIGRRIGAEMFPECAEIHPWATETGRSVPRACGAAPLGYGNGRKCSPSVRCGTVGRRNGAEVFPERAPRHRSGDGIGRKCRPGVRRGAVRRRNGAEMSPERVVMPRWATEWGRSVPRACGAAPLGDGNGRECRPSVWSVPCL